MVIVIHRWDADEKVLLIELKQNFVVFAKTYALYKLTIFVNA